MKEEDAWKPSPDELRMIDEGIADFEAGRTFTQDQVDKRIRQKLKELRQKKKKLNSAS